MGRVVGIRACRHQFRRYARRLKSRHGRRDERRGAASLVPTFVLQTPEAEEEVPEDFAPVVVAELQTDLNERTTAFVNELSEVQYCLRIARAWGFPEGDTIVTARARSARGNLGPAMQMIVRVEEGVPPTPVRTPTPIATAVPTATRVPPLVTHLGLASADDRILVPDDVDPDGRPIYERLLGHAMTLIVEGAPGIGGRRVGIGHRP